MKLYVCWGTFKTPRPGGHPCANAHEALREAGWSPDIERVYGWGVLPDFMNPKRDKIRRLTGQGMVPVLETDDGEVITGSDAIVGWARDNPASGADRVA